MSNKHPWSDYQKNIFKEVSEGQGHVIVEALAGSAKTSSMIESLEYIPPGKSWLLVAFNKHIADELQRRVIINNFNGDIRTLHALGRRALHKKFPNISLQEEKTLNILDKVLGKDRSLFDVKFQMKKTITLCKGYLVEGEDLIDFVMDEHDIDTFEMGRSDFINIVQKTLKICAQDTKRMDFDDMVWMPYVHNIQLQKYHLVSIDELQDLNRAQCELALKACKRNGRIFGYGDSNQSIFKFNGAIDAVDWFKTKLNAKSLPLSISYRCPTKVIKEAQKYVPHIEAAPNAKEGIVEYISPQQMLKEAKPGCFIISRTNAPLVPYALMFLKNGIPATVQGRDIGSNLLNLIKKSRKNNLDSFLEWLFNWERKESERLLKKNRSIDLVKDKSACLKALADSCNSISELKEKITELFEDTDDSTRIVLSTTHRAKGRERDVVYVLWNTYRNNTQEEKNLKYVAVSRSKSHLYYVT